MATFLLDILKIAARGLISLSAQCFDIFKDSSLPVELLDFKLKITSLISLVLVSAMKLRL